MYHHDIFRLKVAMNYVIIMQIFDSLKQRSQYEGDGLLV